MNLNESGECRGNRSVRTLPVPAGSGRLARGHSHPGERPLGDTLGPIQRKEKEWGSSGPRTLKWKDSKDISGHVFC